MEALPQLLCCFAGEREEQEREVKEERDEKEIVAGVATVVAYAAPYNSINQAIKQSIKRRNGGGNSYSFKATHVIVHC